MVAETARKLPVTSTVLSLRQIPTGGKGKGKGGGWRGGKHTSKPHPEHGCGREDHKQCHQEGEQTQQRQERKEQEHCEVGLFVQLPACFSGGKDLQSKEGGVGKGERSEAV